MLAVEEKRAAVASNKERNFARYEAWRQEHEAQDPVLLTLDSLQYDLQTMGTIGREAWAQFDADEMTFLVENLSARHTTPAEYRFNGTDIIVAEAQDNRPELTLRSINEGGLKKSTEEALRDPRYGFQKRRDELFMNFHDEIVSMMQGNGEVDTLIKFSSFPIECTADDRRKILEEKAYNMADNMGFLYIARRASGGRLEFSNIRLDDCTPDIVAECLQEYGFTDAPLALEKSDELGKYLVKLKTGQFPIVDIEAGVVAQFDVARCKIRNIHDSYYGRNEASVDAMDFIYKHAPHWAAYKAYNEQLARALNGEGASAHILQFLRKALASYEAVGASVLSDEEAKQVVLSLQAGKFEKELAKNYKKVLFHANAAYFKDLFEAYKSTGRIQLLQEDEHDMLGSYANAASDSGAAMASRGEGVGGCGLKIGVDIRSAAELAAVEGISYEEAVRKLQKSAKTEEARKKKLIPKHANDKNYLLEKWGTKNVLDAKKACASCGIRRYVAICGICADCDFKDTRTPGYVTRLIARRKQEAQVSKKNYAAAG